MVENQWVQWVPLFGFGSVVTILIAIIGVGIGLWRNASIAHRSIGENIDRVGSRLESKLGSELGSLGSRLGDLNWEAWNPDWNPNWDLNWEAWNPDWNPNWDLNWEAWNPGIRTGIQTGI